MAGKNFGSDNVTPIAPEVIHAIAAANTGSVNSYGHDPYTERLTTLASTIFETDVAIYPVTTGTVATTLALGATKNGAMAAEAVTFFDRARAVGFESRRKRAGHLWSKMRFLTLSS